MIDTFDSSKIQVEACSQLKPLIPDDELVFGKYFTDYMISIEWDIENGWHHPMIKPYGKIEIDPSAAVLHYGFEVNNYNFFLENA